MASKPTFVSSKIFNENLVAVHNPPPPQKKNTAFKASIGGNVHC